VDSEKTPYRVLTIDGGGMRGLYSATVLDTLSRRFARANGHELLDVGKGFDMIAGTSTGGILACALAMGVPTPEIIRLYREKGPLIFQDPIPAKWRKLLPWVWRNKLKPANAAEPLREALADYFGTKTVEEVYRERGIGLCIPTVNVATHNPRIFKTPHNKEKQGDNDFQLVDVCLATSAAPLIFPLAAVDDPEDEQTHYTFTDGGLWANNPVLVGMVEALTMTQGTDRPIEIISIGSCAPPEGESIEKDNTGWGLAQWLVGVKSLSLAMDAQSSGYQFIACMLAKCLTQKCTVIRLPTSPPSPVQASSLKLDRADKKALEVLTGLGKQDGTMCHGKALGGQEGTGPLVEIFKSMPPYPESR